MSKLLIILIALTLTGCNEESFSEQMANEVAKHGEFQPHSYEVGRGEIVYRPIKHARVTDANGDTKIYWHIQRAAPTGLITEDGNRIYFAQNSSVEYIIQEGNTK